jgi:hypothetical protein
MTNRTQHLDISSLLNWVISISKSYQPRPIVCFTKLTEGKSDIAMADEPKTGAQRRKPSDMKMQNKAKYPRFQPKSNDFQKTNPFFYPLWPSVHLCGKKYKTNPILIIS